MINAFKTKLVVNYMILTVFYINASHLDDFYDLLIVDFDRFFSL